MAKLNRIGNTERLIVALRDADMPNLEQLESTLQLRIAIEEAEGTPSMESIFEAIADLIEEAIEAKENVYISYGGYIGDVGSPGISPLRGLSVSLSYQIQESMV